MPYHLPLSPVDRAIQPPVYYLQVQDSLILSVSIFWTIAYVLYVRQGYRDKSYGMPLFALYVIFEICLGFYYQPFLVTDCCYTGREI